MPSESATDCGSKAGEFTGDSPAQKKTMAVVVQAEARGQAQSPVRRQIPGHDRGEVVRSNRQAEAVAVPEPAVHFDAGNEVFPAKIATLRRSLERQGMTETDGVTEFPGIAASQVLGG